MLLGHVVPLPACWVASNGSSAGHEADDRHDDGKHQQQVNQAAGDVESPPKQPQDEQNRKNGPEHGLPPGAAKDLPVPRTVEKQQRSPGVGRNRGFFGGVTEDPFRNFLQESARPDTRGRSTRGSGHGCEKRLLNGFQPGANLCCQLAYRPHLLRGVVRKIGCTQSEFC